MTKSSPEISIIIVSYNVRKLICECISSVYSKNHSNFGMEIIVIDNNSADGTTEEIASKFPEVILITNNYNAGFSTANNQGIEASTGKYIFLLNPDTEICDDVFTPLVKLCFVEKNVILAPRLLNGDGTLQVSCYKFPGVWSVITEAFFLHKIFSVNKYPFEQFEKSFYPDWASGAALFFPKDVYNNVGPLDENLFWMDDVDFCFRACSKNISTLYLPDVCVVHHGGKSSSKNLPVTISNQLISKTKYLLKHEGKIISSISLFFVLFHIVTRILLFLLLSPLRKIYWLKFNAYLFTFGRFFTFIFMNDQSVARKG